MAFRIPLSQLTDQQKRQIQNDLILKGKTNYHPHANKWQKKPDQKEIQFYIYDEHTQEVLLPFFYACCLFNRPFINLHRTIPRVSPFHIRFTLRDYQEEVADISVKNFTQRATTFLNVFCAYGKTRMGVYFSSMFSQQYGLATLVTYPRTLIGKSWVGAFQEHSTAKIYVIGETQTPPEPDTQVFLCMDTRLKELDPWYRARIGHLIVDEAHMYCTSGHVPGLLAVEPIFITMLTATYERDDGFEKMLDLMVGPDRIIRISKKPFYVFQRLTNFTAEPKMGPWGILFDDFLKKLSFIELRNSMIMGMVIDNLDRKPMILTRHVDHAENLTTWLQHHLTPYQKTVTKLAGAGKNYNDAHVIVATISKAGVGFDEENAFEDWGGIRVNLLILTASTKKIEQIAGRVFRSSDPVIFDIVDNYKNCHDHWKIRHKWYVPRNGQVYTIAGEMRFSWSQFQPYVQAGYFRQLPENAPQDKSVSQSHAAGVISRLGKKI